MVKMTACEVYHNEFKQTLNNIGNFRTGKFHNVNKLIRNSA